MAITRDDARTSAFPDLSDPRSFVPGIPHEAFAQMRDLPGLYWQPTTLATIHGGFWAVTRWADIVTVEKDPETFTSTRGSAYPATNLPPDHPATDGLMTTDPPRHSYLRRAAAKAFSPRVVAHFEEWVRDVVREELDRIEGMERFDYVTEIAQRIPARVIMRALGAPEEDHPMLVRLVIAFFAAMQETEGLEEGEGVSEKAIPVMMEIQAYATKIQELKKRHPAEDMFTELNGCVERGELTQAEYANWMQLLLGAGFETTHTTISQSMRMYLEDPEVAERTDRAVEEGLAGRVADEYVRLVSPVIEMARTATRDVELGGEQLREDDVVVLYYPAANRDPAVFSEPDQFDPWRTETETLAFGSGVHRCLGANLALLEIRVLWEELHRRGIRLQLDGEPRRGWSVFINQLTSLPVTRV